MDYAMKFNSEIHLPIAEWSDQFTKKFENEHIRIEPNEYDLNRELVESQLGKAMFEFYFGIKDWIVRWEFKASFIQAPKGLEGSIHILPIEDVLNWKAWDFEPDLFPQMEHFTVLDRIDDSHVVGLYLGQPERGLFYMNMDSNPRPINLDFNGYLEMTKYTKAVFLWQLGCIEPIADKTSHRYLEKLTQIDPTITVEGFYELFDRLRIDK